ncbi:MAG: hypothetical protein ACE366_07415 [Bradymonadia bacterium]
MSHLDAVLDCPTGPFCEGEIMRYVEQYAVENGLVLSRDAHQNLMITYDGGGEVQPALCIQSPIDQPGLEVISVSGDTAEGLWHGPQSTGLASGQIINLFGALGSYDGRVISYTHTADGSPERVLIQIEGPGQIGDFGLPTAPAYLREGAWIITRAAHGLVTAAAILELFDRLQARQPQTHICAVFTRGSVLSSAGAVGAVRQGLLQYGQPVVNLCGRPTPPAVSPGMGPVILAGDGAGLMDAAVTQHLERCARHLADRSPEYDWQRALIEDVDGEAQVFRAHGHPTGAIMLPIHRQAGLEAHLQVDRVHLADYHTLVDLLEAVAQSWTGAERMAQHIAHNTHRHMQLGAHHAARLR